MVRFDKKNNIKVTCKRPFHRVAICKGCSRNTAKKYIGWAVAFTPYDSLQFNRGKEWICFENYLDYRLWRKQHGINRV